MTLRAEFNKAFRKKFGHLSNNKINLSISELWCAKWIIKRILKEEDRDFVDAQTIRQFEKELNHDKKDV